MSMFKQGLLYVNHLESVFVPNTLSLMCQTKRPPPQSLTIVVVKVATRG